MPPVGDLWRVTVSYNGNGGLNQNVLHFRGDTVLSDGYDEWETVGQGILMPLWQSVMGTNATMSGITVQKLTPVPEDSVLIAPNTPAGQSGFQGGNSILSAVITARTGFSSRRKRGRFYMGTVPDSYYTGNLLNSTGVTAFSAFATSFVENFIGDGAVTTFQYGIYSRADDAPGLPFDVNAFTPAKSVAFGAVLGSQRRRRQGVGA